jgi:hypothetical protein
MIIAATVVATEAAIGNSKCNDRIRVVEAVAALDPVLAADPAATVAV